VEVDAGVSVVGADPVETVFVLLDGLNKILAGDNGLLGHLSGLLTGVLVDVNVGLLGIGDGHVVRVLALLALLANTSLEVRTKGKLVIHNTFIGNSDFSDSLEERGNECILFFLLLLSVQSSAVRVLDSCLSAL
jgi:hypothetical protein